MRKQQGLVTADRRGVCGHCGRRRRLVVRVELPPWGNRRWCCRQCADEITEAVVSWYTQVDRGVRRWRREAA